jgi:hypothetical protein
VNDQLSINNEGRIFICQAEKEITAGITAGIPTIKVKAKAAA